MYFQCVSLYRLNPFDVAHQDEKKTKISGGQLDNLTDKQKEVLKKIVENNKITRSDIVNQLKINESAVSKHLEILKEKCILNV